MRLTRFLGTNWFHDPWGETDWDVSRVQGTSWEKPLESVGGVCYSDLSCSSSSCVNAVDNDNESELICGRVVFITAWTECKTSCEWQTTLWNARKSHSHLLQWRIGISQQANWRKEEKNKADGFVLIFSSDFAGIKENNFFNLICN